MQQQVTWQQVACFLLRQVGPAGASPEKEVRPLAVNGHD
jgi:hypothetical protein